MPQSTRHWLRKDDEESTAASFPELFFDLVFVFAFIQLSETLAEDFSFSIAAEAVLFIFALWWVWIHTTWVTNLLDTRVAPVRLLLFGLMFLGIVLSIALPKAYSEMGLVFALAYSGMQLSRSLFALYAFHGEDAESFRSFLRITVWLALSCTFWIAGGLAEGDMRVYLWIGAIAIEYASPIWRYWLPAIGASPPETLDVDGEHLAERCALFVIIALGETILTTGKTASSHLDNGLTPYVLCLAFLSTVLMWWIYFHDGQERVADKAEDDAEPQQTADHLFTYGHLPIIAGIIITAVGEDFSLSKPLETGGYNHAVALLGGPILFLAGTLWMKARASHAVPWSHCAGLGLLAAGFLIVPVADNVVVQSFACAVLLFVALWEYIALKNARRDVA